jgi:surfeit locus 1 family protein
MLIRKYIGPAIALLLALVAVNLMLWQLDRADEKKAMLALRAERTAVVNLGTDHRWQSSETSAQWDQQQVAITGQWLLDKTIFLDNRAREGQSGVHVLTPVRLQDQSLVWVNRGWLAKPPGSSVIPAIPPAAEPAQLQGVALAAVMRRMELSRDPAALRQGLLWQNFDWQAAGQHLPGNAWPVIVWQTTENADGLLRSVPEVTSDVPKHLGYALQWFLLCLVALFFAWRLWKK